ncbi:MAG: hypothetical protein F4X93_02345 [Proteobacteria bacterium]|nr:hypothetical protein [Pseudomonadota bacterium]
MSEKDDQEILENVKSSVDFSIVTDNILGIADFVIEKHEFKNDCSLTDEQREQATAKIKEALWAQVESLKLERKSILQEMFDSAESALAQVMRDGS